MKVSTILSVAAVIALFTTGANAGTFKIENCSKECLDSFPKCDIKITSSPELKGTLQKDASGNVTGAQLQGSRTFAFTSTCTVEQLNQMKASMPLCRSCTAALAQ